MIFPGSSAAWLPFLATTVLSLLSNPSGPAPVRVSTLWAKVFPLAKTRPAGRTAPPELAASDSVLAVTAPVLPCMAATLAGSSRRASS